MTPASLFLIIVAVAGASAVRWATRLAPLGSELPAKTLIATLLAAFAAAGGFGWLAVPGWLTALAAVVAPLFVFAPLLLVYLVRGGGWRVALVLARLLYWTEGGRAAVGRLLAQAALQEGDPEAALALAPERDALLLSQAHLLEGDWEAVLALQAPDPAGGAADNAHLVAAARVEALLELGRLEQARYEAEALRTRYEAGAPGPLGHRAVVLSQARILAHQGDFEGARRLLEQPLMGVRPATLYRLLGVGAERAGRADVAARAYGAVHASSQGRQRERLEQDLERLGVAPPPRARQLASRPLATYLLAAALAASYLVQVLFDRGYGLVRAMGTLFYPSNVVAAFLQGLPGLPADGAWWRYLTYAFVHGNLVHIGFNLWVLFDIGRLYEKRRGWGDLLAAFALGTAVGAYLTTVFQAGQQLILVGASGGILGVAGALLAEALLGRSASDRLLLRSLVQWMVLLLLFSVALPQVSLWGHAGGALGGFVYGLARLRLPLGQRFSQAAGMLAVGLLALALLGAVTTVVPLLP